MFADRRRNSKFRHQNERARGGSGLRDAHRNVRISAKRGPISNDGPVEASEWHPDLEFFHLAIDLGEADVVPGVPKVGLILGSITTADKPAMDRIARLIEIEAFTSPDELRVEYKLIF